MACRAVASDAGSNCPPSPKGFGAAYFAPTKISKRSMEAAGIEPASGNLPTEHLHT